MKTTQKQKTAMAAPVELLCLLTLFSIKIQSNFCGISLVEEEIFKVSQDLIN